MAGKLSDNTIRYKTKKPSSYNYRLYYRAVANYNFPYIYIVYYGQEDY